jgi:Flp pilus assembly protein TadG
MSKPAEPGLSAVSLQARAKSRGQALVEMAIIVPLFLVLLMGLLEFSLAFNAVLDTNFASRGGGLMAVEAGNSSAADCIILDQIEQQVNVPADEKQISSVDIERTNPSGNTVFATSSYRRSGSTSCQLPDGTRMTVPYTAASSGYPPSQRCTVLPPNGCPSLTPPRTTVDTVAVQVSYSYRWHTPLQALIRLVNGQLNGSGFDIVQRNVFRMEPTL